MAVRRWDLLKATRKKAEKRVKKMPAKYRIFFGERINP